MIAWRKLEPADGEIPVECKEARGRAALHGLAKRRLVLLVRPVAIGSGSADQPIHAPAVPAITLVAEQFLEGRPQVGRERTDGELHAAFASCPVRTICHSHCPLLAGGSVGQRVKWPHPTQLRHTAGAVSDRSRSVFRQQYLDDLTNG